VQVFQKDGTFVRNILIPNKSGKVPDKRGTACVGGVLARSEQKLMYMMNGGTEEVHILDHAAARSCRASAARAIRPATSPTATRWRWIRRATSMWPRRIGGEGFRSSRL